MKILNTPYKACGSAGLLFVSLSLIASALNEMPPSCQEEENPVLWFEENGNRFRLGHALAGLAFLLFYFPFYAGFCELLKQAEGRPAVWTKVTWAGAILSPAAGTVAGAFIMGLSLVNGNAGAEVHRFALAGNFYAYTVAGAYGGIAMVSAGILIIRKKIFKKWLGLAGITIGSAALLSIGAVVENDAEGWFAAMNGIAWLAYFLWIAAVSISLIKMQKQTISPVTKTGSPYSQ